MKTMLCPTQLKKTFFNINHIIYGSQMITESNLPEKETEKMQTMLCPSKLIKTFLNLNHIIYGSQMITESNLPHYSGSVVVACTLVMKVPSHPGTQVMKVPSHTHTQKNLPSVKSTLGRSQTEKLECNWWKSDYYLCIKFSVK